MIRPQRFDRPLATQGETIRLGPGKYTVKITRQGMDREEIISAFKRNGSSWGFNATGLMRSLLWEEIDACGNGKRRPPKDTRGLLFYELIAPTFVSVMQLTWTKSLDVMMNDVWHESLDADPTVPELLNVYSEKEALYNIEAEVGNAYPNVLICVEKADWFKGLNDLAATFGVSFCCTGGQKSSVAALKYLAELRDRGIDLDEGLTLFSMYDLDPCGWAIPENLRSFLQRYVSGTVELIRVGLLPGAYDKVGLEIKAKPYAIDTETRAAEKAAKTNWDKFASESGGVYLSDGRPAVVELGTISVEYIKADIIDGLAQYLDGFQYQIDELQTLIRKHFDRAHSRAVSDAVEDWVMEQELNPRLEDIEAEKEWYYDNIAELAAPFEVELSPLQNELSSLEDGRDADEAEIEREREEAIAELDAERDKEIEHLQSEFDKAVAAVEKECKTKTEAVNHDAVQNELGNWDGWSCAINPLSAEVDELVRQRDDATAYGESELKKLRNEEETIGMDEAQESKDYAAELWDASTYKNAGDILELIEGTITWRQWLKDVGIDEVDLAEAAKDGESIHWEPDNSYGTGDGVKVHRWLVNKIGREL